jgi:cold shock protein
MKQGIIAGLTDKGFGFIKVEGMEKDLFFHSKELVGVEYDSLKQRFETDKNIMVSFEVQEGDKGLYASNVQLVAA